MQADFSLQNLHKILDIGSDEQITLGKRSIQTRLERLTNHEYIQSAVEAIKEKGNPSSHSQYTGTYSQEDFNCVVDRLFDLLAFPLINYFEKYRFGTRNDVLTSFSLLPPIIRYKVLAFLYEKDPNNISVIDKLVLAIMKAFSVENAENWVEERKSILMNMKVISDQAFAEILVKCGAEAAEAILRNAPSDMYQLCKVKITCLGPKIEADGPLYSDFESALPYYKKAGKIYGSNAESTEWMFPKFCVNLKKRCKTGRILLGGGSLGCRRLNFNITPAGPEVKGGEAVHIPLISGHGGVIRAFGPQRTGPAGRGSRSSPAACPSIFG